MRIVGLLGLGFVCILVLILVAVAVGSTQLGVSTVIEAVLSGRSDDPVSRIVLDLRLPRALLAVCAVGAGDEHASLGERRRRRASAATLHAGV